MKRKHKRMIFLGLGVACFAGAVALVLVALSSQVTFFYSPTKLLADKVGHDVQVRLGGLVKDGSVVKEADGITTRFVITDLKSNVTVTYTGVLPDLFRAGQGVIVIGHMGPGGEFTANQVLAKHDARYMPPQVAAALKASGHWKEGQTQ